jgi:hypothetical protein
MKDCVIKKVIDIDMISDVFLTVDVPRKWHMDWVETEDGVATSQ